MKTKLIIGTLGLASVLAVGTGVGIAMAKSASNNSNVQAGYYAPSDGANFAGETVNQWYCGGSGLMGGYMTPYLATLLGTTTADLQTQFDSGKTLADIASAKGVSQDQLIQTMMGPYSDHLALMVKYGYLTQAQADTMSQQAWTRLQFVITTNVTSNAGPSGGFGGMMNGLGGMMRGWSNSTPQSGTNSSPGSGYGMTGGGAGRGMMGGR